MSMNFPLRVERHDLDIAVGCQEMIKSGHSVEGLANKAKKCKTVIRGFLRLNELSGVALKAPHPSHEPQGTVSVAQPVSVTGKESKGSSCSFFSNPMAKVFDWPKSKCLKPHPCAATPSSLNGHRLLTRAAFS
jgi:hypothetical protein